MKKILIYLFLLAATFPVTAQQAPNFFKKVAENTIVLPESVQRLVIPEAYSTFELDFNAFQKALEAAPKEFTAAAQSRDFKVSLPLPDGSFETFAVCRTDIMHPDLGAQFPEIKTYGGVSLQHPGKTMHLTTSPRGLNAMLYRANTEAEYVQVYAQGQTAYYMAYDRKDYPQSLRKNLPVLVENSGSTAAIETARPFAPAFDMEERGSVLEPVQLKVYRYAVSTTDGFGQDNGGTVPLVLAKIVEVTNQLTGIFERDIQLRLQLIPQEAQIIFAAANSDPFTGVEVGDWMSQNPQVLNTTIGSGAYDVGHVYARYISGGAIGVAGGLGCTEGKGRGCSGGGGDYGDYFVGVIGQEVGHQLTAGHTWNRCGSVGGRAGNSATEPGGGSTILSYAGACGSDDYQSYSDLYFNSSTIDEIRTFYRPGNVGDCGTVETTLNNHPEVTLPYQNGFFIPIRTPFELNGSATDPDGHPLTYIWEQYDTGPECALDAPQGNAPLFRTILPKDTTNRVFPNLNDLVINHFDLGEQLPKISRDMSFRLVARDNQPNGGGVSWTGVEFKASALAGPFVVSKPNIFNEIWRVGEYTLITWDVANTDNAPVNCKRVNIRLSTDGGFTYPVMLAEGVVNDGSQYVLVPDNVTNKARVRIDAADNIFFDISNYNFKIEQPTAPALTVGLSNDGSQLCLPASFSTEIQTAGLLGFNADISLDIQGLPAGAVATFGQNVIAAGASTTLTIDMTEVQTEGVFVLEMRGIADGTDTVRRPITITAVSNNFSSLALVSPADGATGLTQSQILYWNTAADANNYDVQFASNPSFAAGTIIASKSATVVDSLKIATFLEKGKAYYWRVRPNNECGAHTWTEPFFFSTLVESCESKEAQDLPKNITSNGTPTIDSKIFVNTPGTVSRLNVKQIKGNHASFWDLEAHLISPNGTDLILFAEKCGPSSFSFNFGLNDNAPAGFSCPPPGNGGSTKPLNPLSVFENENITGAWTLRLKDTKIGGSGTFEAFQLEFCSSVSLSPPNVVNNNVLHLDPGTNKVIAADLLLAEDANNTHGQLTFTLVTVPKNGFLALNGTTLSVGDHFTQANIDNSELYFFDYGHNSGTDGFRFTVSDGEGGFVGTPNFVIQPNPVGTEDLNSTLVFNLYPNPTNDQFTVDFGKAANTDTQISVYNIAGQRLIGTVVNAGAERATLKLGHFPGGIYMVMLKNMEGTGVQKLVLRKD